MSAEKRKDWASLFGDSSTKTKQDEKKIDLQQIVQDSSRKIDGMRETFGKNIFKSIKFYQKLMKSKKLSDEMRHNAQEALNFYLKSLQSDVSSLNHIRYIAIKLSFGLYNDEVRKLLESKIIAPLEKLLSKQVEMIRRIHCPIKIQSLAIIKKKAYEHFYETVIQKMNEGDYKTALFMFLANHYIIEPDQAENLYAVAQEAAKIDPIESDDFLEALKLRLFSEESKTPKRIDYCVLKNNQLLKEPIFTATINKDSTYLVIFLDEAVKLSNCFIEAKLKEDFNELILKEIELLVNFVDNEASHDNHVPFLRR